MKRTRHSRNAAIAMKWAGMAARPCSGLNKLRAMRRPGQVVGPRKGLRRPHKSHYKEQELWRAVSTLALGEFYEKLSILYETVFELHVFFQLLV